MASNTNSIDRLANLKRLDFQCRLSESLPNLKVPSEYHSMMIPSVTKAEWDQYIRDLITFPVARIK
eukprot:scaffold3826_cov273-Chaetoceros_neogracile.AAC.5